MAANPAVLNEAPADPLLREDRDGIAFLTLNRPKQYNALSAEMLARLQQELDALARDTVTRVVVVQGAGNAFCAGHDLKQMMAATTGDFAQRMFEACGAMMLSLTRIAQPVIAKVHGIATAAGCQLVAQCDLAVASDDARFATSGVNLGLFCSTPGVALGRNVARKKALEMLFTGEFITAQEALAHGLVNRAVPAGELDAAVMTLAESIKKKPFDTIALGKRVFYSQIEQSLERAYASAGAEMACNFAQNDTQEGIRAFLEKRPPKW